MPPPLHPTTMNATGIPRGRERACSPSAAAHFTDPDPMTRADPARPGADLGWEERRRSIRAKLLSAACRRRERSSGCLMNSDKASMAPAGRRRGSPPAGKSSPRGAAVLHRAPGAPRKPRAADAVHALAKSATIRFRPPRRVRRARPGEGASRVILQLNAPADRDDRQGTRSRAPRISGGLLLRFRGFEILSISVSRFPAAPRGSCSGPRP